MAVPFALFKGPSDSPSAGQTPSCANCRTPLAVGQTWCLECGTAVPGGFGRGPGLRSSLGVVGVTLLLVIGAVAAAYATLASDSRQATQTTASAPAATSAVPAVAQSAVTPPAGSPVPATSSAVPSTAVATAPKIVGATPTPAPAPVKVPTTAVTTPKPATTTPKTTTPKTTTPKTTTITSPSAGSPSAQSAKILLDTNAASSYDPYSLPLTSFGDPANAIDGDPQTAWTYQLDPTTAGKTLIGLAIDLKSAQKVRSVTIATASPGMAVEFYGATTIDAPVSISDPNWHHLATKTSLPAQATVKLKTGGKALRFLLVWITHAPPGTTTGQVGISELSVSS